MRAALIIAGFAVLSGCAIASQTADELARAQAKSVVNGYVETRFPGVNAAPVTDCIIDNATAPEILTIAGTAATGMTAETGRLLLEISQRPDTVTCIASNGFGLLML